MPISGSEETLREQLALAEMDGDRMCCEIADLKRRLEIAEHGCQVLLDVPSGMIGTLAARAYMASDDDCQANEFRGWIKRRQDFLTEWHGDSWPPKEF